MKKKILLFLAIVSMLVCIFAVTANAETPKMYIEFGARFEGSDYITVYTQNAETSGNPRINFNYKFYTDVNFTQEIDISKATGLDFSVAVSHNSEKPVNRMTKPDTPFTSCKEIKWFKSGYTSIGSGIFKDWTALESLDFGCLKVIDYNCFQNTGFKELVIPSTVTTLYSSVFYGCKSLTSVKFEGNVTSVAQSIFQDCTALTKVELPNQLVISQSMFKGCSELLSVTIAKGFTLIDDYAFQNCKKLETCTFLGDAGENAVIDQAAFENCYALKSALIPNGVVTVGNCAYNNSGIKQLTLPSTLTTLIGNSHFKGTSLETVTGLEDTSITHISHSMFRNQRSWKPGKITVPNTVTRIETYGFADVGMEAISIGASVTRIDSEAFTGCSLLKNVYLPGGITTIGTSSFNGKGVYFFVTSADATYLDTIKSNVGAKGIVAYADYNENNYKDGKYVISGYNKCDAFYGGKHNVPSIEMNFVNYLTAITFEGVCGQCNDTVVDESRTIGALFTYHGYSCTEKAINGTHSVAQFFGVNNESVAKYEELTGKTVNFGIVATGNADGTAIKPLEKGDKVITQQFSNYPFGENSVNYFAVKVNGIASSYVETNFVFCAYVSVDGEVVYIDNNAQVTELAGISHSQLNSILN